MCLSIFKHILSGRAAENKEQEEALKKEQEEYLSKFAEAMEKL